MKKGVKRSILLVSLAAVLAGVVGVVWVTHRPGLPTNQLKSNVQPVSVAPMIGYRVPLFSLPSFPDTKPLSLADYQGKAVLINFWASWCPPCQSETPDLVKASAKYGDKVQFIGVNLTSQDSLPDVSAFLEKYGIKYPIALDTKGTVAQQFQTMGIPTSFFVNRQGIIVERYVGAITPQVLEEDLQKISQ
ncbi:Alkyl hydroperoxide reductase/ Thiol specific antioxidant/ Mal allergen [Candidatus Desulfosporosinus infrequens]|uniref:Alkyl hydroperoxide reductase/ Thiol specific antioxidant/ Mal allergen n=1 Tax=Candidatus Desulfosporosinus infrequens TaxID=2043169 RepID=A0A2U3LIT4_9FIRM|nr:Alkyl hydroperoxide reductase/ Thiol specific antioxidant/ Mal allergen [Candidatus Desulfosporosinus infrequens]